MEDLIDIDEAEYSSGGQFIDTTELSAGWTFQVAMTYSSKGGPDVYRFIVWPPGGEVVGNRKYGALGMPVPERGKAFSNAQLARVAAIGYFHALKYHAVGFPNVADMERLGSLQPRGYTPVDPNKPC